MKVPELILNHWQLILFAGFTVVTAAQLFYYFFFFVRLAFYKTAQKSNSQTHAVSVIVCARDEAENLAMNLPALLVQKYGSTHEILVVNDNSFDESKYILEAYQKKFKQLQIVELTQEAKMINGKKYPLSVGIKTAKHEVVLLTDADCVPASDTWIERMQDGYHEDTEIVLGYSAYHKQKGWLNKKIRWETFHTALQYLSYALAGIPYMGVGRNLSYKKAVFFRHKGFSAHNKLASGDDDLFINMAATKKNTRIQIHPESFTLSKPPLDAKQWHTQKRRHYSTASYYKPLHKFLLGTYSLTQFLFYPLCGLSMVFYNWQWGLILLGTKWLVQGIILYKSMKKLGESDLFGFYILFDLWMFFYYLRFAPALFKKPATGWK